MTATTCKVSPVRAVLLSVASLESARRFYETALGMECLGEVDDVDEPVRALWGLGAGRVRVASMGQPEDPYGRVEIVAWDGCTGRPIRDQRRAFDCGILTLNLRTADIEKALKHLETHGAGIISKTVRYPYRKDIFLYEAMAIGPNQERYTLLQLGETQAHAGHVIGDAVATVGTVVPDTALSKAFYADVLGFKMAFEMDEAGELFAPMLGIAADFRMRMTLFTAGDIWTGKLETIEFSSASEEFTPVSIPRDWRGTGYCMLSFKTDAAARCAGALQQNGYCVEMSAGEIMRPFWGPTRAFVTIAPGGVPLEVITNPGEAS